MGKSFRNVEAGKAIGKNKAKAITNDRGNRRAKDTRRTKAFLSELDDMDSDNDNDDHVNYYEALYS